eukprot:g30835.t1
MGQWAEEWQMEFNLDKCESPCYKKDVVKFERVLKRFIRMLPKLEVLIYWERLNRLGLFSLECRRLRGDLIAVYKIMRGVDR